jgi:uncharacterized membrane protein
MKAGAIVQRPAIAKANSILSQFLIYGFIGWFIETIYILLVRDHFAYRGLLSYGLPFIPLFVYGGAVIVQLIKRFRGKPVLMYVFATLLASCLELLTGLSNVFLLNHRTWNYSGMPLSFAGHIALPISLGWGLVLTLITYFLEPRVERLTGSTNQIRLAAIVWPLSLICLICQFVDFCRLLI